ncbi:MAG: apolipoprotein N-acyltransferase [Myxococcota bacterium]|jgi:apolipoprotein N-acyltransferase
MARTYTDQASSPRWRARAFGAALFGGLMVVLAFPTVGFVVPILFAFAPALVMTRELSWKRRLRMGWLLGFVYHMVLFRWIAFTMTQMTNLPDLANWGMVVLYAGWHGLMIGVFFALAEPARRAAEARIVGAGPVAIGLVFVAVEWLFPTLFSWSMGHAFWEIGPLAAGGALTGIYGQAFVIMVVNAWVARAWLGRRETLARGVTRPSLVRRLTPALLACIPLLGFGVIWHQYVNTAPRYATLSVAVLQPNYTLDEKRRASRGTSKARAAQRLEFMDRIEGMLRALPHGELDLVVGPEGGFPYLWRVDADRFDAADLAVPLAVRKTQRFQKAVAEGPAAHTIIGGLRAPGEGHTRTRNAAVHLAPSGMIRGFYDKQTLVPFSEYLPGRDWFPGLAKSIQGVGNFGAGDQPCAFDVDGISVGCGICYETLLADPTREDLGSARLLVNLTIDTWFGSTTAPWFHLMTHTTRAAELAVPLVRAGLTGISAFIDADGTILKSLPLDTSGTLVHDLILRDVTSPYRVLGRWFCWLALALALLLLNDARQRRGELFGQPVVEEPS